MTALRLTQEQFSRLLRPATSTHAAPKLATKQDDLVYQIGLFYGGEIVRELRFHPTVRWRFDIALPELKIAIEIEGGIFSKGGGGRHNRGSGMRKDMRKYNEAAIYGWSVIRVLPEWVKSGEAADYVMRVVGAKQGKVE